MRKSSVAAALRTVVVVAIAGAVLGGLLLLVLAAFLTQVARFGVTGYGNLVLAGALVAVGRALLPLRAEAWTAAAAHASRARVLITVVGLQLAISALGVVVAIAVAARWGDRFGAAIPRWMFLGLGLRDAALGVTVALAGLPMTRRPGAVLALALASVLGLPVVALCATSLPGVVAAGVVVQGVLALGAIILVARAGAPAPRPDPGRWISALVDGGLWFERLTAGVSTLVVAGLAGVGALASFRSAGITAGLLLAPVLLAATWRLPSWPARVGRSVLATGFGFALVQIAGPVVHGALFPASLAPGLAWLPAAAWFAVAAVPLSLAPPAPARPGAARPVIAQPAIARPARSRRGVVAAVVHLLALALLTPWLGVPAVYYAGALAFLLKLALRERPAREPLTT